MAKHKVIGLGEIVSSHAGEVNALLAGIQGADEALWTTRMRAVVRKDDPPEEEDPS